MLPCDATASSHIIFNQLEEANQHNQELNSWIDLEPNERARQANCYQIMWKILEITSLVAFTILSITAVIWTGLVAPLYLPIISIAVLTLMPLAFKVYKFLNDKSSYYADRKTEENLVCKKLISFPQGSEDFKTYLQGLNVTVINADSADKLRPLTARFECLKDIVSSEETKIQKLEEKLKDPNKVKKTQKYRLKLLQINELLQINKIKAAYFLGIMKNPYDQRTLSDVAEIISDENILIDGSWIFLRLLAKNFKDDEAEVILTLKDKTYTIPDIQKMDIPQISDLLFQP